MRVRDPREAILAATERLAAYYVYIMTNRTRRGRLVYFEDSDHAAVAIDREKELKGRHSKKINLQWSELSRDLIE